MRFEKEGSLGDGPYKRRRREKRNRSRKMDGTESNVCGSVFGRDLEGG